MTDATPPLTLGEGATPLVRLGRLGAELGLSNLYVKVEGQNPTGSFKDRGMVVAVSKAVEQGARAIICASTGNTSASAAAYGAAAGLEVVVVVPGGGIALGKLLQALVAGARVVAVDGTFDQALGVVRALAEQDDHPVALVNSVNPDRLEGQKTAAFEVCDDLGRAPDVLAIPVGNAGNISAYWAGLQGLPGGRDRRRAARGWPASRPPAPRRSWWATRSSTRRRSRRRSASATPPRGRRRPPPATSRAAASTRSPTRRSWPPTATSPGSRASSASPRRPRRWPASAGWPPPGASTGDPLVVCVLTGAGLKDPGSAEGIAPPIIEAHPTVGDVARALGW